MADAFAENRMYTRGDGNVTGDMMAGGEPNHGKKSPEQQERETYRDGVLHRSRTMISESTNHWETSYNTQWLRSISNFNSQHPSGSKYNTSAYKTRSRGFRPKTRAAVRKNEAACSTAFFSTSDPLTITPTSQADESQVVSAAIYQSILRHRLKTKMPWFQTVIGAYQDTQVMGACFSHNYWRFETDAEGDVTSDDLAVDLIPPQNIRFHPRSDWRDPIQSSPYIIHIYDMTVDEIRLKMENGEWYEAGESVILAAAREWDAIDAERDKKTAHAQETGQGLQDHESVWVCKIIERRRGIDYCHFVLGEHHLLTDPEPLAKLNPGGIRNYTMGVCNIEAHKVLPAGSVEIYQEVQAMTNDVMNSRMDNVKLAMNGRYLTRRGAKIDRRALTRSVPGGVVDTEDPKSDVEQLTAPDVTGSSYKEQDYISADFDDIAGNFSSSSVNTNRRMGETVGGMELLTGDSNMMMEYQIRIFSETWVKRTLQQFVQLEQAYETDIHLKAMAANENIDLLMKYGINEVTDELLDQQLTCEVAVGIDATNPDRRMQRLMAGVQNMMSLGVPPNADEIAKESWGILGFGDGMRFISQEEQGPTPEQQMAEMEGQKMQADMQLKQIDAQVKQQVAQFTVQREQISLQREQLQAQSAGQQAEMKQAELMSKLEEAEKRYQLDMQKMQTELEKSRAQIQSQEAIALLNDETNRLKIGVEADNKVQDRLHNREIEVMKASEQARQVDDNRDEQKREFDLNQKQHDKDRQAASEKPSTDG